LETTVEDQDSLPFTTGLWLTSSAFDNQEYEPPVGTSNGQQVYTKGAGHLEDVVGLAVPHRWVKASVEKAFILEDTCLLVLYLFNVGADF
jgi:hypothetical protein